MSHAIAFLAGFFLALYVFKKSDNVRYENQITTSCPEIVMQNSSEITEAFKTCQKSLDDRIDKLFLCQAKQLEYEVKIHDLEIDRCQTRPIHNYD